MPREGRTRTVRTPPRTSRSAVAGREGLLRDLLAHFREHRERLRRTWLDEMDSRGLLKGLTPGEVEAESASIYDALVNCLESGRYHSAQAYARAVAERGIIRGIGPKQVVGGLLALRDVCVRSLLQMYRGRPGALRQALDLYDPTVNRILTIAAL